MDKALAGGAALLDRFAKSFGMFADGGTVVNIDQRSMKVAAIYDSLSKDTLRKLAAGETTIDAVLGHQSEVEL